MKEEKEDLLSVGGAVEGLGRDDDPLGVRGGMSDPAGLGGGIEVEEGGEDKATLLDHTDDLKGRRTRRKGGERGSKDGREYGRV